MGDHQSTEIEDYIPIWESTKQSVQEITDRYRRPLIPVKTNRYTNVFFRKTDNRGTRSYR